MKPQYLLFLFPVLSTALEIPMWRWIERAQSFVSNPLARSRVPRFILDSRHPWVLENKKRLENLPDAEVFLCSLDDSPSAEIAGLEIPSDLFHKIEIDNYRRDSNRPGWPNALERLTEMQRCPRALAHVETFSTHILIHNGVYSSYKDRTLESSRPTTELLDLFADTLANMTNLETLQWGVSADDAHYFERHFVDRGLMLPSVRRLEPGPMSHFLVKMCPNITALENFYEGSWAEHLGASPQLLLLRAAASAENLKTFALDFWHQGLFDGWTTDLIGELAATLPSIEHLGVRGVFSRLAHVASGRDESTTLADSLEMLQGLVNLTRLELPPAWNLGLGWDGGAECGNAYFGPEGRAYERVVVREGCEAVERGSAIAFRMLPQLEAVSMGWDWANATRHENGTVEATFPWTGRMEEYVMEQVPEPDKDDPNYDF